MNEWIRWKDVKRIAYKLHSDGCTGVPDFSFKKCCELHDIYYRTGKRFIDDQPISRWEADMTLARCVYGEAKHWWVKFFGSIFIWLGVRLLGKGAWHGKC